jgi:hypothetical protein
LPGNAHNLVVGQFVIKPLRILVKINMATVL